MIFLVVGLVDWGVLSTKTGKIKFDDSLKIPRKVMVSRYVIGFEVYQ